MSESIPMATVRIPARLPPLFSDSRVRDVLTRDTKKLALYGIEPQLLVAAARFAEAFGTDGITWLQQHTILLVKPEAWIDRREDAIFAFLERNRFRPVAAVEVVLDRMVSSEIWRYQWNAASAERIELAQLALSLGPSFALVVRDDLAEPRSGLSAAERLSTLKGPSEPARQRPGQLRNEIGNPNRILSYVHVADEPLDVFRDLVIFVERPRLLDIVGRTMRSSNGIDLTTLDRSAVSRLDPLDKGASPAVVAARSIGEEIAQFERIFEDRFLGGLRVSPDTWARFVDLADRVAVIDDVSVKAIGSTTDLLDDLVTATVTE